MNIDSGMTGSRGKFVPSQASNIRATMRDQRAGGLTDFWKKKVFPDDITAEEDAVQRIHGLAYVAKNKTAQGDIQYRVLEYARRYGAVSASVFGEVESRSNVLASLTSQNSPAKATDCSDEAKDGTASPYPELRSRKLQSMQARDYGLFMIGEARCQKGGDSPCTEQRLASRDRRSHPFL